jgi:hypothetical protein
MSIITQNRVLETIAGLGPLQNVFLVGDVVTPLASIVVWYPEIGLRYALFENDILANALVESLRQAGVRRFTSWDELHEAMRAEQWEGWDTCEDYRRGKQFADDLASKGLI